VERRSWILLALPVFWCLGDGPTVHEPEAVPEMPARREAALPLTDPPVVSMNSCTRASGTRSPLQALARRRVCEALPGRLRAGRRRARYALKKGRRELVTVVGFVAVFAVWRLGARAWWFGLTHAREGVGCRLWESGVPGDGRGPCGKTFGRGTRPALDFLGSPAIRAARAAGNLSRALGRCGANPGAVEICRSRAARVAS